MSLRDFIFGKKHAAAETQADGYFQMLSAYTPVFTSWGGKLYESELARSAIDARARHISKLKVELSGPAKNSLKTRLRTGPNSFQTWGQFLYRTSTILDMQNTVFIVPIKGMFDEMTGFFPIMPSMCEVLSYKGHPWVRYRFSTGETAALPLSEVGIMTKFQYKDDLFGEKNALSDTMNLIAMQNQGIEEGIKNSASYRFMAQVNNFSRPEDLARERKRFSETNLAQEVGGGLLLFPNTYTNIQQVTQKPYVVDAEQLKMIQTNVYNYFGVNEDVLQNKTIGDAWSAFYEGCVEQFAIQLSDVLTKMTYSDRELASGNCIIASANRLQYMSNADKLNVSAQLADRGILSINEIREIWNLPPVDGGDIRTIRGEYKDANEAEKMEEQNDINGQEVLEDA